MIICFIAEIVSRGAPPPDATKSPEPTKKLVAKHLYQQSPTTISESAEVVNLPDIKLNGGSATKAGISTTYHQHYNQASQRPGALTSIRSSSSEIIQKRIHQTTLHKNAPPSNKISVASIQDFNRLRSTESTTAGTLQKKPTVTLQKRLTNPLMPTH